MILPRTWIAGLLCVVLTLFLVQLPQLSYLVQGGAFLLLFGICTYQFLTNRISIYKDGYTIFAGLFTVLCLGSVFVSDITYSSITLLPTYLIVPFVIISFDRDNLDMDMVYKWIMGVGAILGVYALYQFYTETGRSMITANAPFANPNSLAVFLGISCVIALCRLLTEKKQMLMVLYCGIALLCWGGIVTTSARGVMLGLSVVFVTSFLHFKLDNKKEFFLKIVIMVTGAFIVFFTLKWSAPTDIFIKKFDVQVEPIGSRFNIWRGIIDAIISTNPIIGNGIGTFKDVYLHYRLLADRASGLHGHNDVLHLVLEMGVIIIVPLGILAMTVIVNFCQNHKQRILPFALLSFIAGCGMFTSIILLPSLLFLTAIFLVDMKGNDKEKIVNVGHVGHQGIALCFIILMGIQIYSGIERSIRVDLKEAGEQANLENFRDDVNMLDTISLGHHPAVPIFQTSLLLNLWDANLISADKNDVMAELNGYVDRAEKLNRWNVETLYYRGEILKRDGKIDDAIALWHKALDIDPTYVTVRLILVDHMPDGDERYNLLKDGLHLKYWKKNPQKLFGMIMVEAKKQDDTKTYEEVEKRLTDLLR